MGSPSKIISTAPGRVCLFGEHQDYLGLPVIAAAINRYITLAATKNTSGLFNVSFNDLGGKRSISIDDKFEELSPRDYLGSGLRVLRRYGCVPRIGYDIEVKGDIPMNAGASSSSALVVAWVNFLLNAFGANLEIKPKVLAKLAYETEVLEHDEPGGFMDHYSISIGNVIFVDPDKHLGFKVLTKAIPGLIIAESGIPKNTLSTLSGLRETFAGIIAILKEKTEDFNLSEAQPEDCSYYRKFLPPKYHLYLYAMLKNHRITREALAELKKADPNLTEVGKKMSEHQAILKEYMKLSVPKIDKLVEVALEKGGYGAKILGSGGGGAIVVLAPGKENEVIEALGEAGAKSAYNVLVDPGASVSVENNK